MERVRHEPTDRRGMKGSVPQLLHTLGVYTEIDVRTTGTDSSLGAYQECRLVSATSSNPHAEVCLFLVSGRSVTKKVRRTTI